MERVNGFFLALTVLFSSCKPESWMRTNCLIDLHHT